MSIDIIDKLKQKNNSNFKLIDLSDVDYDGNNTNAKEVIDEMKNKGVYLQEYTPDPNDPTEEDIEQKLEKAVYLEEYIPNEDDINIEFSINDESISSKSTWSSNKINEKFYNISNLNIRDFGAVGDGTSDDTKSIQNAIDYANTLYETGLPKKVIFPQGKFYVTSTINIPQTVRIELEGNCYIVSRVENDAVLNFNLASGEEMHYGEWIGGSGRLQLVNRLGRDTKSYGIKIGGKNLCNVYFTNVSTRNYYIGLFYDAQNVWCITFKNCKFFSCTWGFYYGHYIEMAGGVINSGERICFDGCLFTQNYIDCVYHGTNWGQTNFRNCSFDMSDCIFYIQRDSEIGWNANTIKISCHQCHFEGVGRNLGDNYTDRMEKGILYAVNPNSLILSITDSALVVDREFPMFFAIGKSKNMETGEYVYNNIKANLGNRVVLENVMFFPNTLKLATYPLLSNNIEVEYKNIFCRLEGGYIDGRENKLMKMRPISPYKTLNNNPFFQDLTVGDYSASKGTVIGNNTISTSTGLSSISIQDCNKYSNIGKKMIINYNTEYTGNYNTEIQLSNNKFIPVQGGEILISQVFTNALSRCFKYSESRMKEVTSNGVTWIKTEYDTDLIGTITTNTKKSVANSEDGEILTETTVVDRTGNYPATTTTKSDGTVIETSIESDSEGIKYITIKTTKNDGTVTTEIRKAKYEEIDLRADSGRFITLTIISYDENKTELSRVYSYPIYPRDNVDGTLGLTIANPIQLEKEAKYISYILTLRNGKVGVVYPVREIEGVFLYKLN